MDAQQLGERFRGLEVGQESLDRRMAEMQEANEADHGEVKGLLTEIRDELKKKVDREEEFNPVKKRNELTGRRVDAIFAVCAAFVVLIPLCFGLLQIVGGS